MTKKISTYLRRISAGFAVVGSAIAFYVTSLGSFSEPKLPNINLTQGQNQTKTQAPKTSTNFSQCRQFFANGTPPALPTAPLQRELCFEAFAILHSGSTKTPIFVAQRLTRQSIQDAKGQKRTNRFFSDARLPQAERAELSDYKNSKLSKGHMAPAGDMPDATAMAQSFSLANMVPQNQKQNSGSWSKIERDTRNYVMRAQGDVFVITGPFFGPNSISIGANRVRVPTHIFKLVYDAKTQKAWAHWQENTGDARAGPPISYSELSGRIGMDLLPGIALR